MTSPLEDNISIKKLALDDRPREKMQAFGRSVLSDAELIAILIGSGSRTESAVQLAQRILRTSENNIHKLAKLSIEDLNTQLNTQKLISWTLAPASGLYLSKISY